MYDATTRDRFRATVGVITGAVAVASATVAGIVTGLVADAAEPESATEPTAQQAGPTAKAARPRHRPGPATVVRWKERPQRTLVHTRTVYQVVGSSPVGGGTVTSTGSTSGGTAPSVTGASGSSDSGATGSGFSGGGGGGTQSSPPAPPPPPPAPAPPPAPSSGS